MSLPQVITYNLAASSATAIINAQAAGTTRFTLATTILDTQRRILITTAGDETANTFIIVGTNQAGFAVTERITGVNNSTTQSNLDFKTVSSITSLASSAATVSAGTNGVGSC